MVFVSLCLLQSRHCSRKGVTRDTACMYLAGMDAESTCHTDVTCWALWTTEITEQRTATGMNVVVYDGAVRELDTSLERSADWECVYSLWGLHGADPLDTFWQFQNMEAQHGRDRLECWRGCLDSCSFHHLSRCLKVSFVPTRECFDARYTLHDWAYSHSATDAHICCQPRACLCVLPSQPSRPAACWQPTSNHHQLHFFLQTLFKADLFCMYRKHNVFSSCNAAGSKLIKRTLPADSHAEAEICHAGGPAAIPTTLDSATQASKPTSNSSLWSVDWQRVKRRRQQGVCYRSLTGARCAWACLCTCRHLCQHATTHVGVLQVTVDWRVMTFCTDSDPACWSIIAAFWRHMYTLLYLRHCIHISTLFLLTR